MKKLPGQRVLRCLDGLALSLTDHRHHWTPAQRDSYEKSVKALITAYGDYRETDSSASGSPPSQKPYSGQLQQSGRA